MWFFLPDTIISRMIPCLGATALLHTLRKMPLLVGMTWTLSMALMLLVRWGTDHTLLQTWRLVDFLLSYVSFLKLSNLDIFFLYYGCLFFIFLQFRYLLSIFWMPHFSNSALQISVSLILYFKCFIFQILLLQNSYFSNSELHISFP